MAIAEANYKNITSFQTACIRIIKRRADYLIAANIGGEDDNGIPAWIQTATTEEDARVIGNHFHAELKHRYHMNRIS